MLSRTDKRYNFSILKAYFNQNIDIFFKFSNATKLPETAFIYRRNIYNYLFFAFIFIPTSCSSKNLQCCNTDFDKQFHFRFSTNTLTLHITAPKCMLQRLNWANNVIYYCLLDFLCQSMFLLHTAHIHTSFFLPLYLHFDYFKWILTYFLSNFLLHVCVYWLK